MWLLYVAEADCGRPKASCDVIGDAIPYPMLCCDWREGRLVGVDIEYDWRPLVTSPMFGELESLANELSDGENGPREEPKELGVMAAL